MEYHWLFILFIIGLLDLASLICFFDNIISFPILIGSNLISYFVLVVIERILIKRDYGVPLYIVIFLPGVGGLIVSILYACLCYFLQDNMILAEYQRYIMASDNDYKIQNRIDYEKEMRVLSFLDEIKFFDTERKKELIIEFSSENSDNKAYLLQSGLVNEDQEVTHYCAVTLNTLENEYVNLIHNFREEYNEKKSTKALEKLALAFKSYINSGLLKKDTFGLSIHKEYIDVLLKLKGEKRRSSYEINRELIEEYITLGEFSKAKEINQKMISDFPERFEGLFDSLKLAYYSKDIDSLLECILTLKSKEIPVEYKDQMLFWAGKEI